MPMLLVPQPPGSSTTTAQRERWHAPSERVDGDGRGLEERIDLVDIGPRGAETRRTWRWERARGSGAGERVGEGWEDERWGWCSSLCHGRGRGRRRGRGVGRGRGSGGCVKEWGLTHAEGGV